MLPGRRVLFVPFSPAVLTLQPPASHQLWCLPDPLESQFNPLTEQKNKNFSFSLAENLGISRLLTLTEGNFFFPTVSWHPYGIPSVLLLSGCSDPHNTSLQDTAFLCVP